LLVMAIIGGAVFTPMIGLVFQATKSMALAMLVPLACYALVALYAFWASRLVPRLPARA
jgi:FHS family L-fucose permease-like MFS transporter